MAAAFVVEVAITLEIVSDRAVGPLMKSEVAIPSSGKDYGHLGSCTLNIICYASHPTARSEAAGSREQKGWSKISPLKQLGPN